MRPLERPVDDSTESVDEHCTLYTHLLGKSPVRQGPQVAPERDAVGGQICIFCLALFHLSLSAHFSSCLQMLPMTVRRLLCSAQLRNIGGHQRLVAILGRPRGLRIRGCRIQRTCCPCLSIICRKASSKPLDSSVLSCQPHPCWSAVALRCMPVGTIQVFFEFPQHFNLFEVSC